MNRRSSSFAALLLIAAASLLSGCESTRVTQPPMTPPVLHLASSAPLQLAADCSSQGIGKSSVVVEFTVQPDGSTSAIRTPAVPGCLHDALTAWVASFRYAPPGVAVPGTVEWLLVTAKKKS